MIACLELKKYMDEGKREQRENLALIREYMMNTKTSV